MSCSLLENAKEPYKILTTNDESNVFDISTVKTEVMDISSDQSLTFINVNLKKKKNNVNIPIKFIIYLK